MDEHGIFQIKQQTDVNNDKNSDSIKIHYAEKMQQYFEKYEEVKDTVAPVEDETEISDDKNKKKIEL